MLFKRKKKRDEEREAEEKKLDEEYAAEYVKLCEKYGRELVAVNFAVKRIQNDVK